MEPVIEHQEQPLGAECAVIRLNAGVASASKALSPPAHQAERLLLVVRQLQAESGRLRGHQTSLSASENSRLVICCALSANFQQVSGGRFLASRRQLTG
jgi:hypothetical protein